MIRTRFAPSPTGSLHCGNVRTALFNDLIALREQGTLVLRFEDTDQTRSSIEFAHAMQADLHWLGIEWQEGPYHQSERQSVYAAHYQLLEEKRLMYPCFCSDETFAIHRKLQISRGEAPRYPGTCTQLTPEDILSRLQQGQKPSWRFRVPKGQAIDFDDLVKGAQHFDSDIVGDFIIRRADGTSPFLFSNAIDDAMMEITHVLRGEDHLANTPRQLLILQALDLLPPHYGHLPLILGEGGAPLSKREGSFSVHDLRQQGYLPLAILNYLARLGCTYESNAFMTLTELATAFRPERLGRAPAQFDAHQLRHWQKLAVMHLTPAELQHWLSASVPINTTPDKRDRFLRIMQENILFPSESATWSLIFFGSGIHYSDEQKALIRETGKAFFLALKEAIHHHALAAACKETGKTFSLTGKKLYLPIRIALTGRTDGPELAQMAELLETDEIRHRLDTVLQDLF